MSDITALCRQAGMDPAEYISNGATMDTVRQAAVDYLLKHGAPVSSRMNGDEGDNFRQAAVDAMLLRTGVNVQNPAKGAEEMRGYSLRDLAIECMARDGVGTTTSLLRMSKDDLWNEAPVLQPHRGVSRDPGQRDPQEHCPDVPRDPHHVPAVDHQGQRERL